MEGISSTFIEYYEALLGTDMPGRRPVNSSITRKAQQLPMSNRKCYCNLTLQMRITGIQLVPGVLEFFHHGQKLRGVNDTILTLIPKGAHVESVADYRTIAFCNTLYKVISKMICKRLQNILLHIIAGTQNDIYGWENNSSKYKDMPKSGQVL